MAGKSANFNSFSWLKNQLNSPRFLAWNNSLLQPILVAKNQLNSAHFLGQKISIFQLVLLPWKPTEFNSLYCLHNQLNSAQFLCKKNSLFELISWLENQLYSARFLGLNINLFQLIFVAGKSTEFSSFRCIENSSLLLCLKISYNQLFFHPREQAEVSWFSRQ